MGVVKRTHRARSPPDPEAVSPQRGMGRAAPLHGCQGGEVGAPLLAPGAPCANSLRTPSDRDRCLGHKDQEAVRDNEAPRLSQDPQQKHGLEGLTKTRREGAAPSHQAPTPGTGIPPGFGRNGAPRSTLPSALSPDTYHEREKSRRLPSDTSTGTSSVLGSPGVNWPCGAE